MIELSHANVSCAMCMPKSLYLIDISMNRIPQTNYQLLELYNNITQSQNISLNKIQCVEKELVRLGLRDQWDSRAEKELVLSRVNLGFLKNCKSIHNRKFYHILFYHPKKSLYQLFNTILPYIQHPNFYFLILLIKIIYLHIKIY